MKKALFLFFILISIGPAFSQDVGSPVPNLQPLPGGSYIIAMDNTWQTNDNAIPFNRYFNLKAYGLIVHLLNNKIKVKRIIRTGKGKDQVDFTAPTVMVQPTIEATPTVRDFKAGPFVILAQDALDVDVEQIIADYNNDVCGVSGISNPNYKVKVYKTTIGVSNVDIRHDLSNFVPRACILNDGGNAYIHQAYMTLAGIPGSNYTVAYNTSLTTDCFSFASEPHNDFPAFSVVNNIKSFLLAGGNFLAQCEAVDNYEWLGDFQTTNGLTVTNSTPASVSYPNADIPFSQFEGGYSIKQGGSVQNWRLAPGSFLKNYTTYITTGPGNNPIGNSVAKVLPLTSQGGLVFYMGNHSFTSTTDYNEINGVRMYMNAFLTPSNCQNQFNVTSSMNCSAHSLMVTGTGGPTGTYPVTFNLYSGSCGSGTLIGSTTISSSGNTGNISLGGNSPNNSYYIAVQPHAGCAPTMNILAANCTFMVLPVGLTSFSATRLSHEIVSLKWQSSDDQQVRSYTINRKNGVGSWETVATISSSRSANGFSYSYPDNNNFEGLSEYKIGIVSISGDTKYSEIKVVDNSSTGNIRIYPNPADGGKFFIDFTDQAPKQINVYDFLGRKIKSTETSSSHFAISNLTSGLYTVEIKDAEGKLLDAEKVLVK